MPPESLTGWLPPRGPVRAATAILAILAALALPFAAWAQAPQAEIVDPFYLDLFDQGRSARRAGDAGAVRLLRIACFGMLEAPDRLAGCLVELAMAHATNDDGPGFVQAVRRLAEVERRFGGYLAARLDPPLQAAFIEQLAARAPVSLLESVAAWKPAVIRRRASDLEGLDFAARRDQLEQLHTLEPEEPRWRRELAAAVLADGDAQRALLLLEPLTSAEAACIRGQARARIGDCAGAAVDAAACGPAAPEALWNARLGCLVAASDWRAAADLHGQLPPALMASKPYRRTGREIARNLRRLPPEEAPPDDPIAEDQPPSDDPPADTGVAATEAPAATAAPMAIEAPGPPTTTTATTSVVAPPAVPPPSASSPEGPADPAPSADHANPEEPARPATEIIRAAIEQSRRALLDASTEDAVLAVLETAEALRARFGEQPAILLHIAEIHYRLRRWSETVAAIQASGLDLEDRPTFLFYYAVALFESGERAAAASALERAWPRIRQTEFVRSYAVRILGQEPD